MTPEAQRLLDTDPEARACYGFLSGEQQDLDGLLACYGDSDSGGDASARRVGPPATATRLVALPRRRQHPPGARP